MKKIAAIVLSLYMMVGLCGCGGMQTGKNAVTSSDSVSGGSISGSAVSTTETEAYPENYFCTDRDIYYTSSNYGKIIRRPLDGSEVQKVCVEDANLLSVTKDWLYYSSDDENEIWRMSIQHEGGRDFLQEDSAERLCRCADLGWDDEYYEVTDRGALFALDVPAKLEFYDFESGKKSVCMKELLSDKNVGGVEIVGMWDQYAVVTLELYDDNATYGSVYQSYRYNIENDEYELISETGFRNVFAATERTLISDNWYDISGVLSDQDGYDDSDEEEVVMYDVYEKTKQVLLTEQQIYDIFQKEIHPELSKKQIDWVFTDGDGQVYMDAGKIYVQIEALWHEGKTYQMRNYMISISTADHKIYYEKELSDLYETLVEPEKMIWTNNYQNKGDCPFYALEACTEMIYRGKCILYAKSSGKDVSLHLYCYDLESGELRCITDQDIEYYYGCLEGGEAVSYDPDDGALSAWPNHMETK